MTLKKFTPPHNDLPGFYKGEQAVLRRVYQTYVGQVEKAVLRYCSGPDAECLVQDVFTMVIESSDLRAQFKGGNMSAWLTTIASHRAIDFLRRRKRFCFMDEPYSIDGNLAPSQDGEASLIHHDQEQHLQKALELFSIEVLPRLNPKLVSIFTLRFVDHQSQAEAARILNIPRGTLIDREQKLLSILASFFKKYLKENS